jgi:hypothetical protein
MKERFLNIFLFLFSLAFIGLGVLLMFFQKLSFLELIVSQTGKVILSQTPFFIAFFGTIIFAWGVFFFLMTVYAVMELKPASVYGFVFWVFTLWAAAAGTVFFLNKMVPLLIGLGILYGAIFLPFFLSMPMKSKAKS